MTFWGFAAANPVGAFMLALLGVVALIALCIVVGWVMSDRYEYLARVAEAQRYRSRDCDEDASDGGHE